LWFRTKALPWVEILGLLKWLGGIVTVVSLCIGTVTLSSYYLDWKSKQEAVTELVSAADWLVKSEAYSQAWQVYEEALSLTPSSAEIRKGQYKLVKRWLRDFAIEKSQVDEVLSRITVILYRNVNETDKRELATALAHIGWVQIIRDRYSLAMNADVDSLFEQALRADPKNIYANAMGGHWQLRKHRREITVAEVESAESMFSLALQEGMERAFIRRLQVKYLVKASYESYDHSSKFEQAILSSLLNASVSMMTNGEPQSSRRSRRGIFEAYDSAYKGGRAVEASIRMLSLGEHLKVIDWLLVDLDYKLDTTPQGSQVKYIKARLTEAAGRQEEALSAFQALARAKSSSDKLNQLVNKSIERLTAPPPGLEKINATVRTHIDPRGVGAGDAGT